MNKKYIKSNGQDAKLSDRTNPIDTKMELVEREELIEREEMLPRYELGY